MNRVSFQVKGFSIWLQIERQIDKRHAQFLTALSFRLENKAAIGRTLKLLLVIIHPPGDRPIALNPVTVCVGIQFLAQEIFAR